MVDLTDADICNVIRAERKAATEAERERCAQICDEGALKNDGDAAAALMTAADLIRNPVE